MAIIHLPHIPPSRSVHYYAHHPYAPSPMCPFPMCPISHMSHQDICIIIMPICPITGVPHYPVPHIDLWIVMPHHPCAPSRSMHYLDGDRGDEVHGQWGTWVIGHMGNGYMWHGSRWGAWVIGHIGNGTHGHWVTLVVVVSVPQNEWFWVIWWSCQIYHYPIKIWDCLTFSSFLKLILNRFWCNTTHFAAYDLLY